MRKLPHLFSFQGRARRSEWWLTNIGVSVVSLSCALLASFLLFGSTIFAAIGSASFPVYLALNLVLAFPLAWIQLAVSYRRAHDLGESGVLVGALVASSAVATIVLGTMGGEKLRALQAAGLGPFFIGLWVVGILVGLYVGARLAFFPGQPTANAYGTPK